MYRIASNQIIYAMSPTNPAVLKVEDGATVVFETCDCFKNQIRTEDTEYHALDWDRINPASGPLFVEGAEPGDILAIEINQIAVADQGVMVTGPGLGVLGSSLEENAIRIIPIKSGNAVFAGRIEMPLNPMIGVIGTAPAGEAIACGTPGPHGGNMDCRMIREGSTLFLPVNVPGALLAMGDLHAVMGDGEVSVCGLEVKGEVTVSVKVLKGVKLPLPLVKTAKAIYVIASESSLDEAVITATRNLAVLLTNKGGLNKYDALNFLSLVGNIQICQVVDPLKTVRFELSLTYLEQLGIEI